MVEQPDIGSALSALDLFREELEETKSQINVRISVATRSGDYDDARELITRAQGIDAIIAQADALHTQLTNLFDQAPGSDPPMPPVGPRNGLPSREAVRLTLKKKNCQAHAIYNRGSVVVLSRSTLVLKVGKSLDDRMRRRRQELQRRGDLVGDVLDGALVLKTDSQFDSPSAAASFVVGHSASGNRDWIVEETQEPLGVWIKNSDHDRSSNL